MESRRSSTNYWPGFVDALSNMVLAMIFVVLVLALAMGTYSMLVAEALSKKPKSDSGSDPAPATATNPPAAPRTEARSDLAEPVRLRVRDPGRPSAPSPAATTVNSRSNIAVVEFEAQAIGLDERTTGALVSSLAANPELLRTGRAELVSLSPGGGYLTESRQIAFYRAMAVRNVLLDQGMAPDRISVRVLDESAQGERGEVRLIMRAASAERPK